MRSAGRIWHFRRLVRDKIHVEQVLKYIDIESFKTKIEARSQDLMDINEKIRAREKQQNENNEKKTQLTNALVEVEAELKSSELWSEGEGAEES